MCFVYLQVATSELVSVRLADHLKYVPSSTQYDVHPSPQSADDSFRRHGIAPVLGAVVAYALLALAAAAWFWRTRRGRIKVSTVEEDNLELAERAEPLHRIRTFMYMYRWVVPFSTSLRRAASQQVDHLPPEMRCSSEPSAR